MRILKLIGAVLIVLIALFVAIGFLLPRDVHVERSTAIEAPPATVFAIVNGFGQFNRWSPWAQIDPENTRYRYSGPDHGVGARMEWQSENPDVGSGSQEIVASEPHAKVVSRLDFGEMGTATATFLIEETGPGASRVTWQFDTRMEGILERWMGLLMDGWIGADYEKGLANLKSLAESLPAADFSTLDAELVQHEPVDIAYIEGRTGTEDAAIEAALGEAFGKLTGFFAQHDLEMAGAPLAITHEWNEETGTWVYAAALPVPRTDLEIAADSPVRLGQTPAGRMLRVIHTGPYADMEQTYEKIEAWLAAHGYRWAGSSYEQYMNDPADTAPQELVTHIYVPVAPLE